MLEIVGTLFDYDNIVIPTNGSIRKDGRAVMGKGLALKAKQMFKNIDEELGYKLKHFGNRIYFLKTDIKIIYTFPTKHNWYDKRADIDLIKQSAKGLKALIDMCGFKKSIYLPRVGCGEGKLNWKTEVKPVLSEILDDRFVVVKWTPKELQKNNDF